MRGKIAKCELKGKRISQNPDGQKRQVGKVGGVQLKRLPFATQPFLAVAAYCFGSLSQAVAEAACY